MPASEWTESDIQALKAQEAKDLAIDLLKELQEKERGPISPGEVQLRELEYELKLKEAERSDQQALRQHEVRIKELELEMERERARTADTNRKADDVREQFGLLVERVRETEESLGISLERANREHHLKLEQLEAQHQTKRAEWEERLAEMTRQRDELAHEIQQLSEVHESAQDLGKLREAVEQSRLEYEQQQRGLEEELSTLQFEKTKRLTETRRSQELELAKLQTEQEKAVLKLDEETAEKILSSLGKKSVTNQQWDEVHARLKEAEQRASEQHSTDRDRFRNEFLRQYNITTDEPLDVTELYYKHRALAEENERSKARIDKLEADLSRTRQHIEKEPQRIATTVEAARTQVQNIVEPAGKR